MGFKIYKDEWPTEALESITWTSPSGEVVTFWFRPVLVSDMSNYAGLSTDDPTEALKKMATTQIVRVDGLEDADGSPLTKITPDIVSCLPVSMANHVVQGIVATARLGDKEETFSAPPSGTN